MDELQIFKGSDYKINDNIIVKIPKLGELTDFGEQNYYSFIYTIVATPTDMKYVLSLSQIDWNQITDYELFLFNFKSFTPDKSSLVFGDLDFTKFEVYKNSQNEELYLKNIETGVVIDRAIYTKFSNFLREVHGITRNDERAMNEVTRKVLLEEAEENYRMNKDKAYHSQLLPLISSMVVMDGFKYNNDTVWGLKINAFMDAVNRISHIKNAEALIASAYSGFGVDISKINKNKLNYFYRSSES